MAMEDPPNLPKPSPLKKLSISLLLISLPFLYLSFLHPPFPSPSTLLHDATFWFLVSNSIVVFLAADSGVLFSSATHADDLYGDDFAMHANTSWRTADFAQQEAMQWTLDKTVIVSEKPIRRVEKEINENYAKLSDEELNRRVDEFIKRFNKQIRLQD